MVTPSCDFYPCSSWLYSAYGLIPYSLLPRSRRRHWRIHLANGYRGAIHFVSQKSGKLFERPLYTNLSAVPDPLDEESVIDVLIKLSLIADEHPEIEEIEINPLRVLSTGAVAVYVRIKAKPVV